MRHKTFKNLPLHLMLLPPVIIVFIYSYIPMTGIVMAFENYKPARGIFNSKWIGLENFQYIVNMPNFGNVLYNTVFIASMKIVMSIVIPLIFSLLLNEVNKNGIKRSIQSIVYIPHFFSWVIMAGISIDILSPSTGIINAIIKNLGFQPVFFLGDNHWFPFVLVTLESWKEFGFGTIIYMAALTGVDPSLYEAAVVDGANRWKQTIHITIPSIKYVIVLITALSLGNILNAGFDQVFNLYSPIVYQSGDIIDTLVYRIAMTDGRFGLATAIGLGKSFISFIFISVSYILSKKLTGYKIF